MKIATWNVNSINARIDHLANFIKNDQSDIYLIQELKCINDQFPYEKIKNLGYHCYVNGQKAWNGVAILSKSELNIINTHNPEFIEDKNSRFLETEISIKNIKKFGLEVVVAINHFNTDSDKEINIVEDYCSQLGIKVNLCKHWEKGGEGARELANSVVELCERANNEDFKFLYSDEISLWKKINTIAKEIYKAKGIEADERIKRRSGVGG